MSQKERNKEEAASLSETLVNACWQPYETMQAHVQNEWKKQDELLRQSWKQTSQFLNEQRENAQQLFDGTSSKNPYLAQSEAWKNIAAQSQAIMKTPFDFALDLLEKADIQRSERVNVMAGVHDQFVSAAKQNQRALFRLVENNLQKFAGV